VALTRTPSRVRSLLAGAVLIGVGAAVVLPHVADADPGTPTIAQVTAKLHKLARQNEALTEKYNKAASDVAAEQKAADKAQQAAIAAAEGFDTARAQLSQTVIAEYESASFSRAGALLTSQDGQSYIDTLNTLSLISTHRAEVVAQITDAHTKAQTAQKTATKLLAKAKTQRDSLDKQRRAIEVDTNKYKLLLGQLNAQQRAAYMSRGSAAPPTTPIHAGSAAAQKAIDFARAQVGKAYVFAASGPDAFDCSGLTMAAWAQGGVSLPHLASAQYNYGHHVSYAELQPGDLVFMYQPITHVEIYIGDGVAVSAADEQLGIRYVNVADDLPDWAGATRLV
jgi:peptidoglycan DL-endopeptidase CwlO